MGTSITSKSDHARFVRALKIGKPVKRLERRDCVEFARALNDCAGHGMQGVRIALDQRLGRCVAFGDPGTFVEKPRDFAEGLEVEFDDAGAERFDG